MTTAVAALAIPGMLWCSATQYRRYPHASACCARSRVLDSAVAASPPSVISERSRTERGVMRVPKAMSSACERFWNKPDAPGCGDKPSTLCFVYLVMDHTTSPRGDTRAAGLSDRHDLRPIYPPLPLMARGSVPGVVEGRAWPSISPPLGDCCCARRCTRLSSWCHASVPPREHGTSPTQPRAPRG
jgi:hypothetical protein